LGHPVPGGYIPYRNLAVQVGGVSNERVKYGRQVLCNFEPRKAVKHCTSKLQTNLQVREGATSRNPELSDRKEKSRRKFQMEA
jgi:hypothetical protein